MRDIERRLRSLSDHCRHLAAVLLDPGLKKKLLEAAQFFDQQAVAVRAANGKPDSPS